MWVGAGERVAAPDALFEIPGGELDRGLEQRGSGRPDPRDGGEASGVEVEESAQALRLVERRARDVEGGGPAGAGLNEQREELRVGQHRGTSGEELLARPLVARPVGYGHRDSVPIRAPPACTGARGREKVRHAG